MEIHLFQQINAWPRVVKVIWAAQAAQEAGRLGWPSWPRGGPAGPSGLGHTPPPPSGSPLSLPLFFSPSSPLHSPISSSPSPSPHLSLYGDQGEAHGALILFIN